MRQPGEPSVEEILDSIKKVIARDNRAVTAPARASDDAGAAAPSAAPASPAINQRRRADNVLDLGASARFLDEAEDDAGDEAEEDADALVPDSARASMRESLAALAMMAQPAAQPQIVRSGETSLEGLTRELLRPLLADWLERNLPAMVERLVAEEIARIVGKKA